MPQVESANTTALPESRVVPITASRLYRSTPTPEPLTRTPELVLCLTIISALGTKQRRKARRALVALAESDDTARRVLCHVGGIL